MAPGVTELSINADLEGVEKESFRLVEGIARLEKALALFLVTPWCSLSSFGKAQASAL